VVRDRAARFAGRGAGVCAAGVVVWLKFKNFKLSIIEFSYLGLVKWQK